MGFWESLFFINSQPSKRHKFVFKRILSILESPNLNRWVDRGGVFGLYAFSFGIFYKQAVVKDGLVFMILATIFKFTSFRKWLIRHNLFLIATFFLIFVLARAIVAAIEFTEYHELIMNHAAFYGFTFFQVILVSYWMANLRGQWHYLLIAMMTGFLSQILRQQNWSSIIGKAHLYWTGAERIEFGSPASVYGVWCAIIFLACILLFRKLWGPPKFRLRQTARVFLWFVILSVSAIGIVLSQSRSALIGTFFISLPIAVFHLYRTHQFKIRNWIAITAFLIVAFSLTNFISVIKTRLPEANFLSVIHGETSWNSISGTHRSISERLFLYKNAWELWKKQPIFGYGPGVSSVHLRLIYDTHTDKIAKYTHFHNFFLDILVQLGMIGLLFYMIFFFKLVQQLIRCQRKGDMGLDVFLFVLGSFAFIGISCLTDQPLNHPKGLYLLVFLGGTCYTETFLNNGLRADCDHGSCDDSV